MKHFSRFPWLLAGWASAVVLIGGVLTSFHQPFRISEANALSNSFVPASSAHGWSVVHVLSKSCGCSRRVMLHLLQRKPAPGFSERIVLVGEDDQADLPGTSAVLQSLESAGFARSSLSAGELPPSFGLHGVPFLLVTSPGGKTVYAGGYETSAGRDDNILHQVRAGISVAALPVFGCAIGRRTKRLVDPFHLKY